MLLPCTNCYRLENLRMLVKLKTLFLCNCIKARSLGATFKSTIMGRKRTSAPKTKDIQIVQDEIQHHDSTYPSKKSRAKHRSEMLLYIHALLQKQQKKMGIGMQLP